MSLEELRFPVGKYYPNKNPSDKLIGEWISIIEQFPDELEKSLTNISAAEKSWRYRDGGWSITQVVHHCADSHMNSFIRFKLALTEDSPIIKPYQEDKWAELNDGSNILLDNSLLIIKGLHARWAFLLKSMENNDFKKEYVHPDEGRKFSLAEATGLYAWHCKHHMAHINEALASAGKYRNV